MWERNFSTHIDVSESNVTDFLDALSAELSEATDLDLRVSGASHSGLPVSFTPNGTPFLDYNIGWNRERRLLIRRPTRILTFVGQLLDHSRPGRGGRAFLTQTAVSSHVDSTYRQLGTWSWPGDGPECRVWSLIISLRRSGQLMAV